LTGWEQFAEGLARHLAELPSGAVVKIVESDESAEVPRYAQFLQSDDKLFAEVVGDEWLDEDLGAGTAGGRLLADAGWHQPDEDHSGNWWHDSAWPIDSAGYRQLASMVVTGLRDAFRISDLSAFHYEAWNGNAGNRKLDLPLLGLPAGVTMTVPEPMPQEDAIARVRQFILDSDIDTSRYPVDGLRADRISIGWMVYVPTAPGEIAIGRALFYIADDGVLEQSSSSVAPSLYIAEFEQRFQRRHIR
jgi:hypothetical protein